MVAFWAKIEYKYTGIRSRRTSYFSRIWLFVGRKAVKAVCEDSIRVNATDGDRCFREAELYGGRRFVVYEQGAADVLDRDIFFRVANRELPGVLPFDYIASEPVISYRCDITGLRSLSDVLSELIGVETFLLLVQTLSRLLVELCACEVVRDALVLDSEYVFVDTAGGVQFIALPFAAERATGGAELSLVKQIIMRARFNLKENGQRVSELIRCADSGRVESLSELRDFVDGLIEGRSGAEVRQIETESESAGAAVSFPALVRKKTGERVVIDKPVFLIGKDRNLCDFVIANNSAVSRVHLQIVSDGGVFSVTDKNSTNRSYLNGWALSGGRTVVIKDGDMLRLADEDFVFAFG